MQKRVVTRENHEKQAKYMKLVWSNYPTCSDSDNLAVEASSFMSDVIWVNRPEVAIAQLAATDAAASLPVDADVGAVDEDAPPEVKEGDPWRKAPWATLGKLPNNKRVAYSVVRREKLLQKSHMWCIVHLAVMKTRLSKSPC